MVTKNVDSFPDCDTSRVIRKCVCSAIKRFGWSRWDREDLEQDVTLHLWSRRTRFDAAKGRWLHFVAVVCRNYLRGEASRRRAEKRSQHHETDSLNLQGWDGSDRSAVVANGCHARRMGNVTRSAQDVLETAVDLDTVTLQLSPVHRTICQRLKSDRPTSVARQLKMSRARLWRHLAEIREQFERANFRDYF
jgi:hypothetical protein